MQTLFQNLNKKVLVMCSGGPDSMALLRLAKIKEFDVTAIFVHHGTQTSDKSYLIVDRFCQDNNIPLIIEYLKEYNGSNKEMYWREKRYEAVNKYSDQFDLVFTGHHLDDQVETYVYSMIKGHKHIRLIPYHNGKFVRPLLLCKKQELIDYCVKKKIEYYDDPTNHDDSNARSILRNHVIPAMKMINEGFETTVKNKTVEMIYSFDYDLSRMKQMVEGYFIEVPDTVKTNDEFREWINNI